MKKFEGDIVRVTSPQFRYYPGAATVDGHMGVYDQFQVSDTAEFGGFRFKNINGSGIWWGMHVEDNTQDMWIGLPVKKTKYMEIEE